MKLYIFLTLFWSFVLKDSTSYQTSVHRTTSYYRKLSQMRSLREHGTSSNETTVANKWEREKVEAKYCQITIRADRIANVRTCRSQRD